MSETAIIPRFIRLRDAPTYLGMDKNRFNREVRPEVTEIRIGIQGVAFDRLDLDALADQYKQRNGRQLAIDHYEEAFGYPAPQGFRTLHVHDLKHTFGRRLRAAGVSLETRKVLLGHKNGDITTHYSAPEIQELIDAANRVCFDKSRESPERYFGHRFGSCAHLNRSA